MTENILPENYMEVSTQDSAAQESPVATVDAPVAEVEQPQGYQLVAIDNEGLQAAHGRMIEWARGKQAECDTEGAEEGENLLIATGQGWTTSPFKKKIAMLEKRRVFYKKIEEALLAGYVIVPNFQMDVFAVRTTKAAPRQQSVESNWRQNFTEPTPLSLPAGEGEYVNPRIPQHEQKIRADDGKGGTVVRTFHTTNDEFNDLAFPFALAKPVLMQKTAQAMAAKLFDEIGVAVDTQWRGANRGDPIILGRIRNPRKAPDLTFFLGWFFDPSAV